MTARHERSPVTTDAMETPGRRPHWHVEHLNRLLAGLAFVGGSLGSLNLVVGDVLRPGSARVVYACLMAVCFLLSGVLWRWPAVVDRGRLPLVLLADAMYLVIAVSTAILNDGQFVVHVSGPAYR